VKKILLLLAILVFVQGAFGYTADEIQQQIAITNDTRTVQNFYIGGVSSIIGGYVLLVAGIVEGNSNPGAGGALDLFGLLGVGVGGVITFVTQGDVYDLLRRQAALDQEILLQKNASN
jgi:hypothetical protein